MSCVKHPARPLRGEIALSRIGTPNGRPRRLLTNSNRWLARDGIWSWTLPALAIRLTDGGTFRTCPAAGVCAQACYARQGTYNFPAVKAAHLRNLEFVLRDPAGWEVAMLTELSAKRFFGAHVRIHDAGDLFSDEYTLAWLRIIRQRPSTFFYAYTKEVSRYERLIAPDEPENSRWVMSLGGKEDGLVDPSRHRIADVFAEESDIRAAGFFPQTQSDLLAAFGPTPVGMAANRIPQFRARQGRRTFGEWQRQDDQRRAARKS